MGREKVATARIARTDDVAELDAAFTSQLLQLRSEDDFLFVRYPVHEHEIAHHLFEQGSYWRDPDTAGNQQHMRSRTSFVGEVAERTLGHDACSRDYVGHVGTVVAETLDRDP